MRRNLTIACFALTLGACASAPSSVPAAPHDTQERWQRIMQQMREDSIRSARQATKASAPASSDVLDERMPSGIDLARFELPVQYNERVQYYLDLYSRQRRSVFVNWYKRMGRYRGYVEDRLAAYNLPKELVYLALIESGYETGATSSASAVGLWQFMSATARAEGLEVSDFIDERRDPFRSTDAAVRHLHSLYKTFGSWYLAAAAYNSGSGRIARLLKEQYGTIKARDDAFWALQDMLPSETRGYVPGLLAATIIGENRELFGINEPPEPAVRFELVNVPPSTDLKAVARALEVSTEEIRALNPHLIRGMTPPDREYDVRVPVGMAATFAKAFARIPEEERTRQFARTHVVREGETLSQIAVRYGTTVDALQKANRIKRPNAIAAGRKLTIPGGQESHGTD